MSLHDDFVSVVIPVYNSEKFLAESIESVLNQTYKNLEIIAIDDGSTDKSLEILQQFADKITIISQPNQGLAVALKAGIKKIHGKWFKWFSPDDILYPEAIEILVNEAKKLPDNTIIYSNWVLIDELGKKIHDFNESNYNDLSTFEFNLRLLDNQIVNVNTCLIPKLLFDKECLIRNLEDPVAIDYDFFLQAGILFETKFFLIEKPLISYRIHKNQLSHKKVLKTLNFLPKVRNDILNKLSKTKKDEYLHAFEKYQQSKQISKKALEFGLQAAKILPEDIADKLIVFYLNKIRRSR